MDILTGNELVSGATVYLSRSGLWVEDLQQARVFLKEEAEARDAALDASRNTMRINSLEIETVQLRDGTIYPDRIRERIRAAGPTAPRFDRQHLGQDDHVSI
ncbi:MAG: hypothetical protein BGO82_16460 [Devosia sp. 67-54]|uniref:DUF2849 domain-containing protein n=1 Tax=unclassified Devosia TaxID=196773 RepID=UPI00095BFC26|nr:MULTISPECIES: DUF2849 domain-containing protein [unclassified Devosia]MBN9303968.1 DUF2849 domain-containing protein [Devosia sp.]OJX17812.1 MAG: hypothetical protein BGO82_16460 [Devosia sp. 67-54]